MGGRTDKERKAGLWGSSVLGGVVVVLGLRLALWVMKGKYRVRVEKVRLERRKAEKQRWRDEDRLAFESGQVIPLVGLRS